MTVTESLRVALRGLAANKLRSLLTMLGMIIGVASVIAVMSIGRGTTSTVTARIADMGSNLVFVRPGAQQQGGVRTQQGSAPTLTLDDADAIVASGQAPSVALVAPEYSTFSQVVAGPLNVNTRVVGVTETYDLVRNFPIEYGEFISRQHLDARATVVVLGANVAQQLFPDMDPLGQSVRINRQPFRVIGVLKSKGSTGFGSQDDQALVPITTLHTRLLSQRSSRGGQQVNVINVQAVSEKEIDAAKAQIAEILRVRHRITGEDDFTVSSQEDTLATLNQITEVMTMFLGSIAAISLLVGGIGIMNIMLVSVTERTREIGIRKAIGARRKDILMQFLTEATVISVTGGGIGFLAGTGIAMVLPNIRLGTQPLNTVVSLDIAALAMTVSAGIGLFFGIYPAMRAARLHPIEALRHE